jgi:acetyl esterase/lipase
MVLPLLLAALIATGASAFQPTGQPAPNGQLPAAKPTVPAGTPAAAATPADEASKLLTGVVFATYQRPEGPLELKMNIALPEGEAKGAQRPCIIAIHGGAWAAGNRADLNVFIREMAKSGYVAATISYRLIAADVFPAQSIDSAAAVRFLRAHAAEYGIDPDRVGAVGFSAGAHLAMLLGTGSDADGLWPAAAAGEPSAKVNAVVSFFGPTKLDAADIPERSRPLVERLVGLEPEREGKTLGQRLLAASPVTYVTSDDPAMLLIQGTKDPLVPHTQATLMGDAMTQAGVKGRVELILGAGHGWGGEELARTLKITKEFFAQELKVGK